MKKVDIVNFLISYVSIVAGFFLVFGRTKVFSVEEVGIYSYILSCSAIFTVIVNFGIPRIILRYYETNLHNNFIKKVFLLQFGIFISFGIIYVLISNYFNLDYIKFILLIMFNQIMLTNLDTVAITVSKSAISNFYKTLFLQLLNISVLIILFFYRADIYIYLYIFAIIQFIVIGLLVSCLKDNLFYTNNVSLENKYYKVYLHYGFFVMLNGAASTLILNIDNIMIKYYLGLEAVGIYAVAFTIAIVIGMVGTVFARSVEPKVVQCINSNDYDTLNTIYKANSQQQMYIGFFLLSFITLFSKYILGLMGEDYIDGYLVLIFIALSKAIYLTTGVCGTIIGVSEYYRYEAYFSFFLLILMIALNIIFIPLYGINGAAFASLITITIISITKVLFVHKKYKLNPYKKTNFKYLLSSILISFIIILTQKYYTLDIIEICSLLIILFIVYDFILYLLKERELISLKLLNKFNSKSRLL